jgi:L-rhamnose isomerase
MSDYFGKEHGSPPVMNIWVPDGYKISYPIVLRLASGPLKRSTKS